MFLPGALLLAYMFFGWFATVIGENQHGIYNAQVDRSFRMGMMWFIFSEVMFFAAFFGALFYARMLSVPWLGGEGVKVFTNFILWPQFESVWPTNGPAHVGGQANGHFKPCPPSAIPAINTAILLTSGVTITIAHHALRAGKRGVLTVFLGTDVPAWASPSSPCRPTSTARPTTIWGCACRPASTARRSSCSPAFTACT